MTTMKRSIIIAAILAFSSSAWAQTTETFNNFVNGLPVASTFGSGDQMYVRQGGLSKQILGSTVQSGTFTGLFTGTLPFVQANDYNAGSAGSIINAVRGVNGTGNQNTDGIATAIVQSTVNFNGIAPSLYVSTRKQGTQGQMSGAYGIGVWSEAVDNTGGGSISGGRFTASLVGGTGGNGTGNINAAVCAVSYAYCVGTEAQSWNNSGTDANTTFSAAKFAGPQISTCSGTNKCDFFFAANPNTTSTSIWGIIFPSGTVDTTGSVFKSNVTSAHQVDLNGATCSTDCWLGPSGTSKIDGSGNGTFANGTFTGTVMSLNASSPLSPGGYGFFTTNGTNGGGFSMQLNGTETARFYNTSGSVQFLSASGTQQIFAVNSVSSPTVAMTLYPSSGVYIGNSASDPGSQNLTVAGTLHATLAASTAADVVCYATATGLFTYEPTGTTCTVSALAYKNLLGVLDKSDINGLRAGVWTYKSEMDFDDRVHVGLLADDVEAMDPRCATYDKDGKLQNYEDRCVIAHLVAELKTMRKEINELKK
jgi:hypothetical protein